MLDMRTVHVGPGGTKVSFRADKEWGSGAYIPDDCDDRALAGESAGAGAALLAWLTYRSI
ncbi:MAG: hypothetical protein WDN76_03525 [Alphaproteobacteria bacterium]